MDLCELQLPHHFGMQLHWRGLRFPSMCLWHCRHHVPNLRNVPVQVFLVHKGLSQPTVGERPCFDLRRRSGVNLSCRLVLAKVVRHRRFVQTRTDPCGADQLSRGAGANSKDFFRLLVELIRINPLENPFEKEIAKITSNMKKREEKFSKNRASKYR